MSENTKNELSKVPAVTLTFWVVKILATTLGETGGDAVSRLPQKCPRPATAWFQRTHGAERNPAVV